MPVSGVLWILFRGSFARSSIAGHWWHVTLCNAFKKTRTEQSSADCKRSFQVKNSHCIVQSIPHLRLQCRLDLQEACKPHTICEAAIVKFNGCEVAQTVKRGAVRMHAHAVRPSLFPTSKCFRLQRTPEGFKLLSEEQLFHSARARMQFPSSRRSTPQRPSREGSVVSSAPSSPTRPAPRPVPQYAGYVVICMSCSCLDFTLACEPSGPQPESPAQPAQPKAHPRGHMVRVVQSYEPSAAHDGSLSGVSMPTQQAVAPVSSGHCTTAGALCRTPWLLCTRLVRFQNNSYIIHCSVGPRHIRHAAACMFRGARCCLAPFERLAAEASPPASQALLSSWATIVAEHGRGLVDGCTRDSLFSSLLQEFTSRPT